MISRQRPCRAKKSAKSLSKPRPLHIAVGDDPERPGTMAFAATCRRMPEFFAGSRITVGPDVTQEQAWAWLDQAARILRERLDRVRAKPEMASAVLDAEAAGKMDHRADDGDPATWPWPRDEAAGQALRVAAFVAFLNGLSQEERMHYLRKAAPSEAVARDAARLVELGAGAVAHEQAASAAGAPGGQ